MDRIEFIITYRCNSRCSHCQLTDRKEAQTAPTHLDKGKAVEIVRKVGQTYTPKSIMTFGGEPLLYASIVCAIHKEARKVGISSREVITNGFWSTKTEKIRKIAEDLARSGVNKVSISVDCFHQEFIPTEIVRRTAASCVEAGIDSVKWNPCWVISKDNDNKYNRKTMMILKRLRTEHVEEGGGNPVQPEGRARVNLVEFIPPRTLMPKGKCGDVPYTEALDAVKTISVEPDGRISVCKNFYIGNAFETDIIKILSGYDPFKIPEAASILTDGMKGLVRWAKKRSVMPKPEGYFSICHLCTDIRERTAR